MVESQEKRTSEVVSGSLLPSFPLRKRFVYLNGNIIMCSCLYFRIHNIICRHCIAVKFHVAATLSLQDVHYMYLKVWAYGGLSSYYHRQILYFMFY